VIVAFDADVLIYSIQDDRTTGHRVVTLLNDLFTDPASRATGSVLLWPEVLSMPFRDDPACEETARLTHTLARMHLAPVDEATARLALTLAARYRLRAAEACHLATAVLAGADAFVTNNRKDFPQTIAEVAIWYPEDLPPGGTATPGAG